MRASAANRTNWTISTSFRTQGLGLGQESEKKVDNPTSIETMRLLWVLTLRFRPQLLTARDTWIHNGHE